MSKAVLVFRRHDILTNGWLCSWVVWKVEENPQYPDGCKYRLALVNVKLKQVLVLFDNHYPKGHHRHWKDGREEK